MITGTEKTVQEIIDNVHTMADRTSLRTQQIVVNSSENDYLHINCAHCNRVAQEPEHVAARNWAKLAGEALEALKDVSRRRTPLIQQELARVQERLTANEESLLYWQQHSDTSLAQEAIPDYEERITMDKQSIVTYTAIMASREAVGKASLNR